MDYESYDSADVLKPQDPTRKPQAPRPILPSQRFLCTVMGPSSLNHTSNF